MIEAYLALHAGVTQEAADQFDMAYEKHRKHGDPTASLATTSRRRITDSTRSPPASSGCSPSSSASIGEPMTTRCRANDSRHT
jgi:hypothetical protein